ncbi:acyl carrier protein [Plantactinospora sp. KBS50]|uniref:acyl carrier protein n=1 Tax=Plantactinospora sp. KBS50 TaxID=2024580 RepID=UPI000BAAF400|nr:phosphopantetheine-binding protein [Plantactinospora sp. KBS50]ASW56233.1 hypothetical protein CIK06_21840 [Plantactinospora sp. KBS50]
MQQRSNEMTATDLRELAAEAFEVEPGEITGGAGFYADLGIDSLQKIEFVVQLERRFGIRFTDSEAAGLNDFTDVLTVLRARGVDLAD